MVLIVFCQLIAQAAHTVTVAETDTNTIDVGGYIYQLVFVADVLDFRSLGFHITVSAGYFDACIVCFYRSVQPFSWT